MYNRIAFAFPYVRKRGFRRMRRNRGQSYLLSEMGLITLANVSNYTSSYNRLHFHSQSRLCRLDKKIRRTIFMQNKQMYDILRICLCYRPVEISVNDSQVGL